MRLANEVERYPKICLLQSFIVYRGKHFVWMARRALQVSVYQGIHPKVLSVVVAAWFILAHAVAHLPKQGDTSTFYLFILSAAGYNPVPRV